MERKNTARPPDAEKRRLMAQAGGEAPWHRWGPYLGERQWGTVREDYSANGEAWEYFPHDHSRSRAYRWGEDGIAGFSDDKQRLCLALALWNGRDPILKERLFGVSNSEGNHGEDVKELYYYLDATPSHAYLKMLYKYPQRAFPYAQLLAENRRRGKEQPEYELLDTGVFEDDHYFDVFIEYAKADVNDILMRVTVHNRGSEAAPLHLLPQLWFRNTWSWGYDPTRPRLSASETGCVVVKHRKLGRYHCHFDGEPNLLFCDNDTNLRRLYGLAADGHFKDAFHDYLIEGEHHAINPQQNGTKAAGHYHFTVPAQASVQVRLRLTYRDVLIPRAQDAQERDSPVRDNHEAPFADFDQVMQQRIEETDAYYAVRQQGLPDAEAAAIQRQALAGMIWSKQFYYFDIPQWLDGDPGLPAPPPERRHGRNSEWRHLNNADVISMPDKWEYPWYAAWDHAFHCIALAQVDPQLAKQQLLLMTREWYLHPNGQMPAYEWDFGNVNPPVHAWAAWEVYKAERDAAGGVGDTDFLERTLHKLLLNFTWWVNRKDAEGHNVFQGGFLGLDNIGVIDRSAPLNGGYINQADGTSWMAMYTLNLMRIALELAQYNRVYDDLATKFFEHFLYIAEAMNNIGDQGIGLWDEEDQFFYDVLRLPDGTMRPLKLRSIVGLIPLFAVEILEPELLDRLPDFKRRLNWFLKYRPDLASLVSHWNEPGRGDVRLLSLLREHRMKHLLRRMLDEREFLSDYGIRSLSRAHADAPYVFGCMGTQMKVQYEPGESLSTMFGGNSNWRGPVWFPINYLLIVALRRFAEYYGPEFRIECPTGSGNRLSIDAIADQLAERLLRLFRRGPDGRRPIYGDHEKLQTDPHFRDHLLFHEYFHGDTGRGLGASHQTGWTALVANLIRPLHATGKTGSNP
ncbi:MGH1-like glycoside hydrolase domain-containing protein [Thiohalomonas denitrificans]|uniref:Glycosyl hydrolase family 63 C-terminal domain-containing protein n=1 Tax=Thiohalomonas denitrificans TaxID=415747 RepID=A0A1G5R382_9GAMM|nr:glucosidase [Thiohalomonas denitrificans]SCZ68406.1 Glycosyl hydrolase family 63 C-terminal domain-containing protein [Thiohalomonas denitrificans]